MGCRLSSIVSQHLLWELPALCLEPPPSGRPRAPHPPPVGPPRTTGPARAVCSALRAGVLRSPPPRTAAVATKAWLIWPCRPATPTAGRSAWCPLPGAPCPGGFLPCAPPDGLLSACRASGRHGGRHSGRRTRASASSSPAAAPACGRLLPPSFPVWASGPAAQSGVPCLPPAHAPQCCRLPEVVVSSLSLAFRRVCDADRSDLGRSLLETLTCLAGGP